MQSVLPSRPEAGRWFALGLMAFLAACASQPKTGMRAPVPPTGPAVPGVKIGTPYEVFGVRYVPKDDRNYDEKGIASWYGPTFHTKPTANGEIYNQEDLTAAHKTLPMPSWVEVTNLENGRKQILRINDRGPFVDGRIIDLSRKSAEVLGVERPGLARVRVKRVFPEWDWVHQHPAPAPKVQYAEARPVAPVAPPPPPVISEPEPLSPMAPVPVVRDFPDPEASVTAAPQIVSPAPPAVSAPAPLAGAQYIQVAALSDEGRARALASVMADYGPSAVQQAPGGLWRVRIGPLQDNRIGNILYDVQQAGYRDARIVR